MISTRLPPLLLALGLLTAPAVAAAESPPPPRLALDLGGRVLELVLVKAGSFDEGSPPSEAGRKDDELLHKVKLSADFYIGQHPVTRGEYARFVAATAYRTEAEKGTSGGFGWDGKDLVQRKEFNWKNPGFSQTDEEPVTLVTYDDALAFTGWLTRAAGRVITLPTEAQWEYAYRGGSTTPYYGAKDETGALALGWFKENSGGRTHPVAQKKANLFNIFDMGGHVHEWCLDWYAPYGNDLAVDPVATVPDASDKPRRVLRGGSWLKEARNGRAAARYRNTPGSRNADNGFRIVAATSLAPASAPIPTTPPGPMMPPVPPSPPSRSSSDGNTLLGGLVLGGGCLGALGVVIALGVGLSRMARTGRESGSPGVAFRTGRDGFWVHAPAGLFRSTLRYRWRTANGATQDGQIVLEPSPSGQFVYTGAAPASVVALAVLSPSGVSSYGGSSRSGRSYQSTPDPEPFRGYPSAY